MVKKSDKNPETAFFRDFEMRLYESAVRANPGNIPALTALGALYTRMALHEKALEIDRRLVTLLPDDVIVHYNLACSLAMIGQSDRALDALEMAVLLGYDNLEHMKKDSDLDTLRQHPRYQVIEDKLSHSNKQKET
jgi:tetratricopeptide (TPR) repeat protein